MLWEPERHEPLVDAPWDGDVARAGIREIAAAAEAIYDPLALWPVHPSDGPATPGVPWTSLYCGASGIALALCELARTDAITVSRDWRREAARFVDIYVATPETGERVPSLMVGEVGVRAVANLDDPALFDLITANMRHPANEMLWGAPGTMLPALVAFERTGDPRWRDLFRANAVHLIASAEPFHDVWLWTQALYNERVRLLGAAHGFAGNVYSLLRGGALLDAADRELVSTRAAHTLAVTALRDDTGANWLPHVGTPRAGRDKILVQWCHGAPGMILALANLPHGDETDELLAAGGELIWRAGPLAKGSNLCHGTAGNGFAFLALYARTGDQRWLDRARRFALHALGQVRAEARALGRGRFSLWTGDVGVALFLHACLDGDAPALPGLAYY